MKRPGDGARNSTEEKGMSRRSFLERSTDSVAGAIAAAGGLSALMNPGRAYPAGKTDKVRLAVVGGGFGSRFYWHLHPNCEVTAVTDLRPDRREILRRTYKCDNVYDSLEQMIKKEKNVDAVAIFTEAINHARHVKMSMENGWHVICAVPACFTVEEAETLKEVKERTGLRYMMAETSYYRQPCIFARNLYEQGGLGELFYSELEYYHDRGDLDRLVSNKNTRFYTPEGARSWRWGYPPLHYPTHCLGLLVGVTGERIVKVSAQGWGQEHPFLSHNQYDNPFWNEASMMQTDRGHMTRCNVFWLVAAHGERAQWFGDEATLYMPKGGLHEEGLFFRTNKHGGDRYDLPTQKDGRLDIPEYWKNADMLPPAMRRPSGHGGSHTFLTAEFINALVEDREPAIPFYDSLAMTVPGIVAHQSALKDGEDMKVPQFEPEKT